MAARVKRRKGPWTYDNAPLGRGGCEREKQPSRPSAALSHVRCLLLRSTFAATAPRSAVAELEVVRRCHPSRAMNHSSSSVCHEAGVVRRSSRLARATLGGASGGAVGMPARSPNALQAGHLGLRATRRTGFIPAVPHSPAPNSEANATPNHALQRTAPRVTLAAPRRPAAQPARHAPPPLRSL